MLQSMKSQRVAHDLATEQQDRNSQSGSRSVSHSVMSDSATPWTITCQAPLSLGFSRQDTGMGCHSLLQGIFLTQGLNPPALQADSLRSEPPGRPAVFTCLLQHSIQNWAEIDTS